MGMYNTCYFERFSITNVEKFQRRITKWCREECLPGKSMLIFDRSSLKVGEPQKFNDETGEYYKVVLPQISFTYTHIANTKMCVMQKIWENHNNPSVMYNMPSTWESNELWLCT